MAAADPGRVRLQRFPARTDAAGRPDHLTSSWLRTTEVGFLAPRRTPDESARTATTMADDGRTLIGAYDATSPWPGWAEDLPVATCATMTKGMNVGGDRDLPVCLVADVVVLASHRGQGLMRTMIVDELRRAREQHLPAAALYAARADLYGRFGFGPATQTCQVEVSTRDFALNDRPRLTVVSADPARLTRHVRDLHRSHHRRTRGSIEMLSGYPSTVCGIRPGARPDAQPDVHAFAHVGASGEPDGIITYRFTGWTPPRSVIEIIEVLAHDPAVEAGLWSAVCTQTLADVVVNRHCAPDSPLPWSLVDRRAYRQVLSEDGLWLRLLDVPAALSARGYDGPDTTLTLKIEDALGLSDATVTVDVRDGRAHASPTDSEPDIVVDVASLSSLYLGGYSARQLASAGLLTARHDAAIEQLNKMFWVDGQPYCNTHF